jgi:hypothetical protein
VVRKNTPTGSAAEFAAMWNALPSAKQQAMLAELRDALHVVRDADSPSPIQPVHPPFSGRHAHPHYQYDGHGATGTHNHVHEHGADGTPDASHDHEHAEGAAAAAHHRHAQRGPVLNAAVRRTPPANPQQRARQDSAWARLADGVQASGQRKGQ